MISREKQIKRLYDDFVAYGGRVVLAVDVDDTIIPYKLATQEDCEEVISIIKEAQDTGALVAINTACNKDREDEIREYCEGKGLKVHGYNETIVDVPYGKTGSKIYANIYLDDRGSLHESVDILRQALYLYRGHQQSKKSLDDWG